MMLRLLKLARTQPHLGGTVLLVLALTGCDRARSGGSQQSGNALTRLWQTATSERLAPTAFGQLCYHPTTHYTLIRPASGADYRDSQYYLCAPGSTVEESLERFRNNSAVTSISTETSAAGLIVHSTMRNAVSGQTFKVDFSLIQNGPPLKDGTATVSVGDVYVNGQVIGDDTYTIGTILQNPAPDEVQDAVIVQPAAQTHPLSDGGGNSSDPGNSSDVGQNQAAPPDEAASDSNMM